MENDEIKKLFLTQLKYYQEGTLDSLKMPSEELKLDKRMAIVKKLLVGDYFYLKKDVSKNDSVFKKYFGAFEDAQKLKDTFLLTEALRKINVHILYRARDTAMSKAYLKMYEPLSKISAGDFFWFNYLSLGYEFVLTEHRLSSADHRHMQSLIQNAYSAVEDGSLLLATLHQIHGIYLAHWLKDYDGANENNLKAKKIYSKDSSWFAKNKLKGLEYNTNINFFKGGDFRGSIAFFIKDLDRNKEPILLMHTNEWLYKCYEGLKQYDSAHYYFKEMVRIKEEMKQTENATEILKFSTKYDFSKKEQELAKLANEKRVFRNSFYTLIPVLGVITLILGVIFLLYRRYRKKSENLEEEKSETLQKLDELKKIVIKNHIILKDKTKVYIADLMYVKADDHYLNLFLADGKNNFVRGKLKNIKEELPPNFIQCHRSYIVNSNFIKQINRDSLVMMDKERVPLSRSFKDDFR